MIYTKHKTTQSEFVAAWWDKVEKETAQKLEEHYPGVLSVKLFYGMTYADKLRAIPNNALRRAGLKPRRRNGKRKKEQTVLSQASMQKILRSVEAMVTSIAVQELKKRTEQFADLKTFGVQAAFTSERYDALAKRVTEESMKPPEPDPITYAEYIRRIDAGYKYDARLKIWRTDG